MNIWVIQFFRVVHIIAGSFWFGAALLNLGFLAPAVRALGPTGGQVMRHIIQVRRLPLFINGSAVVAVLSGIVLYGWRSSWFQSPWMSSGSGTVFGVGGLIAIAALGLGIGVVGRTAVRLGELAAKVPPDGRPHENVMNEIQRLQRRMFWGSLVGTSLIAAATAAMAVGRYI